MKTEDIVQKLIDMSEENAKLSAALRLVKIKYQKMLKEDRNFVLEKEEAEEILSIAEMLDKEVEVIDLEVKEDAEKLDA